MKAFMKILLVGIFSVGAIVVSAQSRTGGRPVSKAVQKVSNKWLMDEQLLTVSSRGYQTHAITKDVQLISNRLSKEPQVGNMISIGYPRWIIQKRVHKTAKPSEPSKKDIKMTDDLIM